MLVFRPNFVPTCTLYAFPCVPNFKAIGLRAQVFCKSAKRRKTRKKKPKKLSKFLQACISGMTGVIFFKFGKQSSLVRQHFHNKLGLLQTKGHGAMNRLNSYFVLYVSILKLSSYAPYSRAAQHTILCLDKVCTLNYSNRAYSWSQNALIEQSDI